MNSAKRQQGAIAYYLGSKRRIADEVADAVCSMAGPGNRAVDLFSGMGSASVAIAKRMDVTSVDVQEYSRVMCAALLEQGLAGSDERFFASMRAQLDSLLEVYGDLVEYELNALKNYPEHLDTVSDIVENGCLLKGVGEAREKSLRKRMEAARANSDARDLQDSIVRYFGGTYFSYGQAAQLAAARSAIELEEGYARTRLLAALIAAASHCASTVGGQFAQPLRTVDGSGKLKVSAVAKAASCRSKDVEDALRTALAEIDHARTPRSGNRAVRSECLTWLSTGSECPDVIYADPPYSRYHYSRYYHVLETIALGDEPEISLNPGTGRPSRGIYRTNRYQSPFSTRGGAAEAFERLFRLCSERSPRLVLSYSPFPSSRPSTPRMASIDELVTIAGRWFKSVTIADVEGVKHSKLAASKDILEASPIAEVLLLCSN